MTYDTTTPVVVVCDSCALPISARPHSNATECVMALQAKLAAQRELARTLAFDISCRFLVAIENLITTCAPAAPVAPEVKHVLQLVYEAYAAMGDWSPLREQEVQIAALTTQLAALQSDLQDLTTRPR